MKGKKIKVSAVSYLNTLPFIYGINNSEVVNDIELSLDIPSDCAEKLLKGEVDLGLVPVAIIPKLKECYIVSDYCIGAEGEVDSVALYSDVPLNEIEEIYLDYQSKTSVNLVQVLANNFWKITPKWINSSKGFENKIKEKTAGVIIGDRTFALPKTYNYKYDLAGEWLKFTGLPFVFACWVANKRLSETFIQQFNKALNEGVKKIPVVAKDYKGNILSEQGLKDYLTHNISYLLNENKHKAISEFLNFIKKETLKTSEC